MNRNDHLEKAERLDATQNKLDPDVDWESIIDIIYNAAIQYIAYYCEMNLRLHRDTHKGLPRFLDDNGLSAMAQLFRDLDILRISRWYGGQGNGNTVRLAREKLIQIKQMCGI